MRGWVRTSLLILSLLCLYYTSVYADGWGSFRHDIRNSGRSESPGPERFYRQWTASAIGDTAASPISTLAGIYCRSNDAILAFDEDGNKIWSYNCPAAGRSSCCAASDGTIYAASADGYLHAISQDGSFKRKKSIGGTIDASPAASSDGSVYIGSSNKKLLCFDKYGAQKFAFAAGGAICSTIALASDKTAYFGCDDGCLYAVTQSGTLKWKFRTAGDSPIKTSPCLGPDGSIYFGTTSGQFYALTSGGVQRWKFNCGGSIYSSAALGLENSIYFGSRDGNLYCLSTSGSLKWKHAVGQYIDSSPAVDSNGAVYFATNGGLLISLNIDGSPRWSENLQTSITASPALSGEGNLFITDRKGHLFALCSGPKPPPAPEVYDTGSFSSSHSILEASWHCNDIDHIVIGYRCAIGSLPGVYDVMDWTDLGLATQAKFVELPLVNGSMYYISVIAYSAEGGESSPGVSDSITIDYTPPAIIDIQDGIEYSSDSTKASVTYTAQDSESGIVKLEYSVGKSPGSTDIRNWTETSHIGSIDISGISLSNGMECYINIRAINAAGLAWSSSSDGFIVDLTPPSISSVNPWVIGNEIRVTPKCSDNESKIDTVACAVSETNSANDLVWVSKGENGEFVFPVSFETIKTYYIHAKAKNGAGLWSGVTTVGPVEPDKTPPAKPVIIDDGEYTSESDSLHAKWNAVDNESGISEYMYCLGTSPGSDDVIRWTSCFANDSVYLNGLNLSAGAHYYFGVKARNNAGLWSETGVSDGIECRPGAFAWPKFRYDTRNTGYSGVRGPVANKLRWQFRAAGYIESSAAVNAGGTAFFGSSDGYLYAIGPSGTSRWAFKTGGCIESSPAVGADGTIFAGSHDGFLYAIYPNGTIKWKFAAGGMIWSSPALGQDGTVYFGSQNNSFYAVNPDGTLKWRFRTSGPVWSSPAIASDGTLYVGCADSKLYAITPGGLAKWAFRTGSAVDSSPAIDVDGTIYFGSGDGAVYAVDKNGFLKWKFATGELFDSSPALSPNGMIYIGSGGLGYPGALYALNTQGRLIWKRSLNGGVKSSPTVDTQGIVYVGSGDGKITAFDAAGNTKWTYSTGQSILASPVIAAPGILIVGSDDGTLYCIADPDPPYDNTPPSSPLVTAASPITLDKPLTAQWYSFDEQSGIAGYSYAIGTSPGKADISAWTDSGLNNSISINNSGLIIGESCYVSVIARNGAGLLSDVGISPSINIIRGDSQNRIGYARKRNEGFDADLLDKVITAVFSDCVYIGESDRSAGICCLGIFNGLSTGDIIDVKGKLASRYGEPVLLNADFSKRGKTAELRPVGIACDTPSRIGVSTLGMLVKVTGKVIRSAQDKFILYDGTYAPSGRGNFGIEVRTAAENMPPQGSWVSVSGIACRDVINSIPVCIIRATEKPYVFALPGFAGSSF